MDIKRRQKAYTICYYSTWPSKLAFFARQSSLEEDHTIIQLHDLLGNKWSTIATLLPKRTDNDIKNHCNTNNKKDKNVNVIKHMAQWVSVRLEAESRLSNLSISSLSNKNNNNAMYNSCSIMLAIDHDDPLSPISKLNFHSIELHVPTNNELCSLSYESDHSDSNMMETTNGEEIMDGYVLQDDDDIMEAFRDHSFNGHTIMEFNGNGKGNLDTSISFLK
ncbi:uncharacterized protein [Cicer arietinum]|uniref:uncharacterized protein isoform X2 n=1 Tax=Cicer arietinum TaxID=3827 RepID=UPI003CC614EE